MYPGDEQACAQRRGTQSDPGQGPTESQQKERAAGSSCRSGCGRVQENHQASTPSRDARSSQIGCHGGCGHQKSVQVLARARRKLPLRRRQRDREAFPLELPFHLGGKKHGGTNVGQPCGFAAFPAQAGHPGGGPKTQGVARKLARLRAKHWGLEGVKNLDGRFQFLPQGCVAQGCGLGCGCLACGRLGVCQRNDAARHHGSSRRGAGHPSGTGQAGSRGDHCFGLLGSGMPLAQSQARQRRQRRTHVGLPACLRVAPQIARRDGQVDTGAQNLPGSRRGRHELRGLVWQWDGGLLC